MDGDWLACELDWRNGQAPTRFGPDEEDPGDLPQSIGFDTQNPGGYGSGGVTLARPPWIRAEDAPLFGAARFYGPGAKNRYQGRVKGTPQIGVNEIRIDFEGWSAHLADDETFRLLGVHNDLSAWDGPSLQRRLDLDTQGVTAQENGGVASNTVGLPTLVTSLTDTWSRTSRCEMKLNVEGLAIGSIQGVWGKGGPINAADTDWIWQAILGADDTFPVGGYEETANLRATGPDTFSLSAGGTRKVATVLLQYDGAGDATAGPDDIYWYPTVFGDHGLTPYQLPDGRWGLLGSDILRYALPLGAPLIPMGTDSVEDSAFIFPHVVHTSGGVQALIEYITAYGGATGELNDWGVYEEFFWRSPGWGRTWRVRRDQVVTPNEEGPVGDERCTGVMVAYQDGAGQTKTVGPTGSGADYETALLEDTDPSNPASRLNGTRRKRKDAGLTDQEGAVFVGQAILEEQNANTRRGSATIQGYVTDDAGNEEPTCAVRACDRLMIEDEEGVSPQIQPINSTSYSHDDLTVTANLGATPHRVDVLLAELAARTP